MIPVIVMLLASAMVMPVGLSYATVSNSTNQTSSNGTMTVQPSSNQTGVMNQTMTTPLSNSTSMTNHTMTTTNSTAPAINDTGALQVSTFIHQAVADFTQQGDATRQVIFDCRDKVQAAASNDIDQIKQDCSLQLNTIKVKYQDERSHYNDLIKQYRQSVMVFLNDARGQTVSKATMDGAVAQLAVMMQPSPVMGQAATTNNTHCVNPPGGPAIC